MVVRCRVLVAGVGCWLWLWLCVGVASAAVTPGWECIPTKPGHAVLSGGTAAAPSCGAGTTAVLAPTYVSKGVGGKPTVKFASVNVQILNGANSTSSKNGKGNLVLGYDQSPGVQSGSHNLVLGNAESFTSFGGIVDGYGNTISASNAVAFGLGNKAGAAYSSIAGGEFNLAADPLSSIEGGCDNLTGTGTVPSRTCNASGVEAISGGNQNNATGSTASMVGGLGNTASGAQSTVTGGEFGVASDPAGFVGGGCNDVAGTGSGQGTCTQGAETAIGGDDNRAQGNLSMIAGGDFNTASAHRSVVVGGGGNTASGDESATVGGQYGNASDQDSLVAGGCDDLTGSATAPSGDCKNSGSHNNGGHEAMLGGLGDTATGRDSATTGGEFNIAADQFSTVAAGCDNLSGSGTANTNSCDAGGEGLSGGTSLTATDSDETYGWISDGVNYNITLQFTVPANTCGVASASTPGTKVGDTAEVSFKNALPAGLSIQPETVSTANQLPLAVCNTTGSSISFTNQPAHLVTFR